ncbi:hypothetical protein GC197_08995 [bacterium]|nr:hypothetical protein [bacterium]
MSDRIDNNSSSAQRVPSSSSSPPVNTPAVNQAAAEFASLLGSDNKTSSPNDTHSNYSVDHHSDSRPPEDQQVDRRDERNDSEKDSDGGSNKEKGKGKEGKEATEVTSPGDQILKSFGRFEGVAKADAPPPLDSPKSLEGIIQAVADKMLVSEASGNREVRIMLKDSILPGTEVRISQQAGKMQVQFVTDSAKSQEMLSQHQAILQQRLNDKLTAHDVVVSVEMESQGHGDQHDGESRGKREQQPEEDDQQ